MADLLNSNNLFAMIMAQGGSLTGEKTKGLVLGSLFSGLLTKTAGYYFQAQEEETQAKINAQRVGTSIKIINMQQKLSDEQYKRFREKFMGTVAARTAFNGLEFTGSPIEVLVDSLTQIGIDEAINRFNLAMKKSRLITEQQLQEMDAKMAKYSMIANIVSTVAGGVATAWDLGLFAGGTTPQDETMVRMSKGYEEL